MHPSFLSLTEEDIKLYLYRYPFYPWNKRSHHLYHLLLLFNRIILMITVITMIIMIFSVPVRMILVVRVLVLTFTIMVLMVIVMGVILIVVVTCFILLRNNRPMLLGWLVITCTGWLTMCGWFRTLAGGIGAALVLMTRMILVVILMILLGLLKLLSQCMVISWVQHETKDSCTIRHGLTHQTFLLQQLIKFQPLEDKNMVILCKYSNLNRC